jgi:hypothetical protein
LRSGVTFHMADIDNHNVSVSEARVDATPGTGQTVADTHRAEDVPSDPPMLQQRQTGIDTSTTSLTATTRTDQQQPPEAAAMPNESYTQQPPEQENAVPAERNGDVADTEEHGDTNNVSVSSDRPPAVDEGFEQVRLDDEGQHKLPQGTQSATLTVYILPSFLR